MRLILVAVLLLGGTGCLRSFNVSPIAASQMKAGEWVLAIDRGLVKAPAREDYEARVVLERRGPTRLVYPEDPKRPGGMLVVSKEELRNAHDNDYDDDDLDLSRPMELGVAPMGFAPAAARGVPLPARAGVPVLWARDEGGRVLEIPLPYVRFINVDIDMPVGGWFGIIGGSIGGAIAVSVSLYLAAPTLKRSP